MQSALQKVAFAELRVNDLDAELDFVTNVLGLQEIGRDADAVYLGCGFDDNIDLTLRLRGTGVQNFAFSVEDSDALNTYEKVLKQAGVDTDRLTHRMPGVVDSLMFTLPDGNRMELAVLTQSQEFYLRPSVPTLPNRHIGVSPLDLDHIVVRSRDVNQLVSFAVDLLGFRISDAFESAPGVWGAAWARVGEYHHDMAMLAQGAPGESLDHLAWTVSSFDHIKRALDCTAAAGVRVEAGPGRHGVGGNLYAYFWTPGGNRFEFSAEMPRVVQANEPKVWTDFLAMFSAWGAVPPETFEKGS